MATTKTPTKKTNNQTSAKSPAKKSQTKRPAQNRQSGKASPKGATRKTKRSVKKGPDYGFLKAGAWILLAAVLLGIFTYIPSTAPIAVFVHGAMLGLFAKTAYLVPLVLLALFVYVLKVKRTNKLILKLCLSIFCIILTGGLITLFMQSQYPSISSMWEYGNQGMGGGILGGGFAVILASLIGRAASIVIVLILLAVSLSLLFKVSFVSMIGSLSSGLKTVRDEFEEIDDIDLSEKGKDVSEKIRQAKKKSEEIKESSENAHKFGADADLFSRGDEEKSEEVVFDAESFLNDVAAQLPQTEGVKELLEEQKKKSSPKEKPEKVAPATEEEKKEVKNEIEKSIEKPVVEYKFPPINLLNKVEAVSSDKRREMYETANRLMTILKNFGVEAKLLQVTQGPAVTRYEIQPSTGIKLAKITSLAEDIALNLAVPTVLVAAVPGKAAVGIEVPNNAVGTVTVRELVENKEFKNAKSKLTVALGKDIGGNVVVGDIAKFPHILIAGSTGSGKSVCINTIITSILYKASPDEVKLIMIDPKVVELSVYNGIPHLLIPVVTDPKKAAGALNWAVGEMMRRYALFAETGTRNLAGYNEHIKAQNESALPQIVIIIDELADLMMVAAKEVEDYICRLAQLARAAGIHLIIATQRPSVDVITGLIKANVPSRIAFAVSSGVDSRTILDKVGAEKLLGKGDMLYHPTGLPNALRVQGAFVSDSEIEGIIDFIKSNCEETSYAQDLEEHIERMATGENGVTDKDESEDADELLPQAIEIAAELGQISTAMIQRKMKVGYARAGRIIDQMETRGLISGPNGAKPRDVYLNRIRGLSEESFEEADVDENEE
ncbi:MAG: DNA translocase FtsK [Ruminococcaceae bacterium]|nr:DNA translocase FtsK [Oscillospiraceae bacterium]